MSRNITEEAVRAFANGSKFKSGNTVVEVNNNTVTMRLHGSTIAERVGSQVKISNCGYATNVTKERLNGVISHYKYGNNIYAKKFVWYWKDGEEFPSNTMVAI